MLPIDIHGMDQQNKLRLAEIDCRANQFGPLYAALPTTPSRLHRCPHPHVRQRLAAALTAAARRLDPTLCAPRPEQATA